MNENQEIFTAEQFRAQAVELSQAVAELQRRDSQRIDPKDPFENETEFHDFQSDYAEIVPQIRIPGCRIPLRANAREKSRVRRYYNMVGGFLLGHLIVSNLLAVGMELLILALLRLSDSMTAGTLPENYSDIAFDYFWDSSSMMAMNLLSFGLTNVLVFWLGCKATKVQIPNLFQTKDFNAFKAFSYITIVVLIQYVTGWAAYGISDLFEGVGITLFDPDLSATTDPKSVVLSFIYSVIVAPITEELLMRGFVLKNLSRVSQHFGIIMSAFIFGLWHENVAQFILAFFGGLFFGYIAVKHNSLVPSIICHMAVNMIAEIESDFETFGLELGVTILDYAYLALVMIGLVMLIRMLIVERFPQTTPQQSERGLRQAVASPLLVVVLICHAAVAVSAIVSATNG